MQYNTNHETNRYQEGRSFQSNSYNGSVSSRPQLPNNAHRGGKVIANIRFHDEPEPYNVVISTESSTHPVVTLGQLKNHLPISEPSKYSYFFRTSEGEGYFAENNDNAMLPILPDQKGRLTIKVQCKPAPQMKKP